MKKSSEFNLHAQNRKNFSLNLFEQNHFLEQLNLGRCDPSCERMGTLQVTLHITRRT